MAFGKKKPEPVSWSGKTENDYKNEGGDSGSGNTSNRPCDNGHRTPVQVSRDRSAGTKQMTCQSCGVNWSETI